MGIRRDGEIQLLCWNSRRRLLPAGVLQPVHSNTRLLWIPASELSFVTLLSEGQRFSELRLWCNSSIFIYYLSLQMTFHLSWSCSIILYGRELPKEMPCARWFGCSCPRSCREQPGHWEATWAHGTGRTAVTTPGISAAIQARTQRAASGVGSAGGKPDVGDWVDLSVKFFLYMFFCSAGHIRKHHKHHLQSSPLFRQWLWAQPVLGRSFVDVVNSGQIQLCPLSLEKKYGKTHFIYGEHEFKGTTDLWRGHVSHKGLCPGAFTCRIRSMCPSPGQSWCC